MPPLQILRRMPVATCCCWVSWREWKVEIVRNCVVCTGPGRPDAPDSHIARAFTSPCHGCRAPHEERARLAGFHGRASDTITEIPDCHLLDPALIAAIPVAEALAVLGGSRKGVLAVTITLSEGGLDVAVKGGKPLDGPLELTLAQATEKHGLARLSWDGEVLAMREPPVQRFGIGWGRPAAGRIFAGYKGRRTGSVKGCFRGCGPRKAHCRPVCGQRYILIAIGRVCRSSCGRRRSRHDAGTGSGLAQERRALNG